MCTLSNWCCLIPLDTENDFIPFFYIFHLHFLKDLLMHITRCPSIFLMTSHNKIPWIQINPSRMHSLSSVQVHKNISKLSSLQSYVRIKPLILHSASSVHVPSLSINKCFYNGPGVVLSPLNHAWNVFLLFVNNPYTKTQSLSPNQ